MTPHSSQNDARGMSLRDAEATSYCFLRNGSSQRANHVNVSLTKSRRWIPFTLDDFGVVMNPVPFTPRGSLGSVVSEGMPLFAYHVLGIVGRGSKEKVIGTHARRVIAGMTNKHSVRNDATGQGERNAMRPHIAGIGAIGAEAPVTVVVTSLSPEPAFAGSVHLRPEACFRRSIQGEHAVDGITDAYTRTNS